MKIFEQKGYAYKKHISTGGEGEVHLIEKDDIFYIAKIFDKLDASSVELLKHIKEIKAPNVPEIFEIFNHNDKTILIRDYIDGHTLYDKIEKEEMLSFERAKFITLKICETLNTFHNLKPNPIIYRDLKPENIMISKDDEIFLIDFGIARYHKKEVTRDTVLAGTKGYTAPEVMAGMQSDKRSDIYSIGLIFYEMLTGKNLLVSPFQVRPVKESNELIPTWVDGIVEKATGISMVTRYKDIDEFVSNLKKPKKLILNKLILIITGSIIILLIVVGLGVRIYNNLKSQNAVQANQDNIEQMQEEKIQQLETYNVLLDLEFDDEDDASWFEILGENAESIVGTECVANGVFKLKGEVQLKQALKLGKLIHIQVKSPSSSLDGPMFMMDLNNNEPHFDESQRNFRFYFDNNQPLMFEPSTVNGFSCVTQNDTAMLMRDDKRIDVIIWLDDQDDSVRYIVSDTASDKDICYMGVTLDTEWQSETWMFSISLNTGFWNGAVTAEDLYTDIEFIRISSGSIKAYLKENIPAYTVQKENVDAFLAETMPLVSELNYMKFNEEE